MPDSLAAGVRCDGQLCARPGDLVGDVEVRVADEAAVGPCQHVPDVDVAAVPEVQHHVLGQRACAVGLGDLLDEHADLTHVGLVEMPEHLPLHVHAPTLRVGLAHGPGRGPYGGQPTGAGDGSGTTTTSSRGGAITKR